MSQKAQHRHATCFRKGDLGKLSQLAPLQSDRRMPQFPSKEGVVQQTRLSSLYTSDTHRLPVLTHMRMTGPTNTRAVCSTPSVAT